MAFVIPPGPAPAVAVDGSDDLFPVHRVYCVGRNYAEHAREMGHDPDREPPFFFQKSPDNLLPAGLADGAEFPYPPLFRRSSPTRPGDKRPLIPPRTRRSGPGPGRFAHGLTGSH